MTPRRCFVRTSLVLAASLLAACGTGGSGEGAGPIEVGLRSIPLSSYELALEQNRERVEVWIGDVTAAANANGLAEPSTGRDLEDEVVRWVVQLGSGVEPNRSELTIPMPFEFSFPSYPMMAEEILGIDTGALERYAALYSVPFEMLVMEGDLGLSTDLDEVASGVFSFGDGEDYSVDLEARGLNSIGRPVRIASEDGSTAMSPSTAAIERWVAGGDSLAADDDYLAAAQALDAAGALGANFVEGAFDRLPFDDTDLTETMSELAVITEPFELVALGATFDDGVPGNAVVYVFADEQSGDAALAGVEAAWTSVELVTIPGSSIDDRFEFEAIERTGNVVTVRLVPADSSDTTRIYDLLARSELQFFSL